jgi:3-deoxy-7-phosphoheptulonate synthase
MTKRSAPAGEEVKNKQVKKTLAASKTMEQENIEGDDSSSMIVEDTRIMGYDPLLPPQILQIEHPLPPKGKRLIQNSRQTIANILKGDDRLLVIVGPCSIHDTDAALDYGIIIFLDLIPLKKN